MEHTKERLTVQDLTMFIGCFMEMHVPDPVFINTTKPQYRLVGIDIKKNECYLESFTGVSMWYNLYPKEFNRYTYIKPILRPLLDISPKELLEFKKVGEMEKEDLDILLGGTMHLSTLNNMTTIVKYLISKQFDVFGYIEKGLAIDSTKQ